jgi:hypothetical protein
MSSQIEDGSVGAYRRLRRAYDARGIAIGNLRVENQQLRDIEEKAQAFVATTTYWRQRVVSRPAFEALAFALLDERRRNGEAVEATGAAE